MPIRRPFLDWRVIAALIVVVAVIYYLVVKKDRPEWVADCPDGPLHIVDTIGNQVITDIPIAPDIDEVPEFHDCQRFLIPASRSPDSINGIPGDAYGPLIAIWASQNLADLFRTVPGIPDTGQGGSSPGDSLINAADPQEFINQNDSAATVTATATPVAQIFHFDNLPYDPLHIYPGMNCLYLAVNPQARSGFEAFILKLPEKQVKCDRPDLYRTAKRWRLAVRIARNPNPTSTPDIPPVARWDYDPRTRQHYVGIRCGTRWCDVGGAGFRPGPSERAVMNTEQLMMLINSQATVAAVASDQMGRVLEVKGWFDEQELAVRHVNQGIIPSQVVGLAIPHPQLQELSAAERSLFEDTWVAAAYVVMDSDYQGKVPFSAGVTRVFLCAAGAEGCPIPGDKMPACTAEAQNSDDRWFTMNISASSDTTYRCVRRHEHAGVIPAGAARWRWSEHDEQLWVRCTNGCCLVN